MEYKVTWEIDVYAENPQQAAEIARKYQLDPTSTATSFVVEDQEGNLNLVQLPVQEQAPAWIDRHLITCHVCGELADEREATRLPEGGEVCYACAKKSLSAEADL